MPESSHHNTQNYAQTSEQLKTGIKQKFIKGSLITIFAQSIIFSLQIGATFVLGYFLLPEDFGLIGMVSVVLGFIELFKDLGLSNAAIQSDEINDQQINTLFWINVALSIVLSILFIVLSPVLASLYKQPRLVNIVLALSLTFVFRGLSAQHRALLKRQMSFPSLAKIDICAKLLSTAIVILAAWSGLGYWSLVLWRLSQAAAESVGTWLVCPWKPKKAAWASGTKKLLLFGSNVTGFNIVNYFSRSSDNFLIGLVWGAGPLGLYAMAYRLLLLPIQQINAPFTSVVLPTLCRLQNQPKKYSNYYYKSIFFVATVGMSVVGLVFLEIDDVISIVFGSEWQGAIPIFKALVPAAMVGTLNVADGWAYQSLGNVDRMLKWGVVNASINIVSFIVGLKWGAIGVAAAFSISTLLRFAPRFIYCYQGTVLTFKQLLITLVPPFFSTVIAVGTLELFFQTVDLSMPLLFEVAIGCLAYALIYITAWLTLPGKQFSYAELYRVSHELIKFK